MKNIRNRWCSYRLQRIFLWLSILTAFYCFAQDNPNDGSLKKIFPLPEIPDTLVLDGENTIIYYKPQLDEEPEFPGRMKELMYFLSNNIIYPQSCVSAEGRNITRILIDKEGKVRKAETVQSVWDILDKELLRVISLMPLFKPEMIGGTPVNSWYYLPISFHESIP